MCVRYDCCICTVQGVMFVFRGQCKPYHRLQKYARLMRNRK